MCTRACPTEGRGVTPGVLPASTLPPQIHGEAHSKQSYGGDGTEPLGYAKSALAEEVALQLGVQQDQAFITDD
ncbi:hypothetical protein HU200_003716 [Digitaria exilis]|uniref:Uncharacterized protein n=1 Tax=Digitaria exilis TaxID=1010633 RepID=A0A835KU36_9POAL|nr:hypothetical protein HU200_003716 [Digitaria exilis]